MPKPKIHSKSRGARLKALPWAALAQVAVAVGRRWKSLSEKERARLAELTRESRGRLGNLSAKERGELRKLAGKLDLKGLGRELLPLARGGRAGRRARRHSR
ncbi:MAG: hypothetical protein H0X28_13260 [Solirubrobacterales bacterium]|nr:hypothetical protein [Solirubrobacterales bacterium]